MWTDSHAHLADLDPAHLSALIAHAHERGVDFILNTATSLLSSNKVCTQSTLHSCLRAAVGISPFDACDLEPCWQSTLAVFTNNTSAVAIGEIGMDATNPSYPPQDLQRRVFEDQLDIAKGNSLPVILHSRGCEHLVLDICIHKKVDKAIFHCYTGSLETAKRIVEAGYYISFSGIITFKNSAMDECVAFVPLSSLLIETDSPYLAPVPHRGKTNEPALVVCVGQHVAKIKQCDEQIIADACTNNFLALFTRDCVGSIGVAS